MAITVPEILARLPDEPSDAHTALCWYAGLGPGRSLEMLAEHCRSAAESPPTRRLRTLCTWSSKWGWVDRVTAYDEQLRAEELAANESQWAARREQIREESWQLAQRLRDRALELLSHPTTEQIRQVATQEIDGRPVEVTTIVIKPSKWAQRDIPAIAETYTKLARLAAGMDTDQIRVIEGLDPDDLEQLSDEELAALAAKIKRKRGIV